MSSFAENLKNLPGTDHLAALLLLDEQGALAARIENLPCNRGSIAIYNHLAQTFGAITREAAEEGLELYAEQTEEARRHPGKHPNIDRLLALAPVGGAFEVKPVIACW